MKLKLPGQKDIYSVGFDKTLNRPINQTVDGGGVVYDASADIAGQTVALGSSIGGWSVGPSALSAGSGSISVGFDRTVTSGDDVRIYAGDASPSRAPFRVTESGALFASSATLAGSITGSSIDIPNATSSTSFHVDATGNAWWGANVTDFNANHDNASAYILNGGTAVFTDITLSGTITGSSISSTNISGIPNNTSTDISIMDFTHDIIFSSASKTQVNWASGTITMSNGRSFSISSGNTSTMAAKTYIYLDPGVSSTVLQITTTATTAMGANKKLIAVAQNGSAEATFQVNTGIGGLKLTAAMTSISNNDWTYSGAFTVASATQINWASGTLTTSNGGSYSITGSNTSTMAAKTYVYFDLGTSSTAFQLTTTASTAIGDGKILIAICKNGTNEANFMLLNDNSYNIDAANIVTGSITANEIAASTITGAKIAATTITATNIAATTITSNEIAANTITGGNILTMNISGKSATFDTGTIGGFTMSANTLSATNFTVTSGAANTANVTVGTGSTAGGINSANASGDIAFWAGSTFASRATAPFRVTAGGAVVATSATISGYVVSSKGVFGGDGSDGALSISSGTTTINLGNADCVIKNYTSISITGTGALAFSNPNVHGTIVILKSQGGVTITSSTNPAIDMRGVGATGGAATVGTGDGSPGNTGYTNFVQIIPAGTAGLQHNGGAANTALGYLLVTPGKTIFLGSGSGGGGAGSNNGSGANAFGGGGGASVINAGTASSGGSATTNPGTAGAGGAGGGALYIECAGAYNASSTIRASGVAGTAGGSVDGNGGGGGGGGMIVILYNTLTSNTGTYTVSGGAGGAGDHTTNFGNDGGTGGLGYSFVGLNNIFA